MRRFFQSELKLESTFSVLMAFFAGGEMLSFSPPEASWLFSKRGKRRCAAGLLLLESPTP